MLSIEDVELYFGDRPLLDGVSALVQPGDRTALVGPNGAGKSTLLKIIAGVQKPDSGNIQISNGEHIGYLPQDGVDSDPDSTVLEEVKTAFAAIWKLEADALAAQEELGKTPPDSPGYPKKIERYGELQHRLESSGVYQLKSEIERVLMGLGFSESDFERPTSEFSGGWLMRIALAKLLLKNPTYLLLDEPTNHLDIESLQWIQQFLVSYKGALIVVSHDRAFLDDLTTKTLVLRRGALREYAGNYSFYERKWAEEKELLINAKKNQDKQLKDTQEFIERFRYKSTKARQVQSRIKQLDKFELIEIEDEAAEVSFKFPEPERSGAVVLNMEELTKKYGNNTVFESIELEINRGEKIAIVGPNGAGKSTLIRVICGMEDIQSGKRNLGYNVSLSYFAQHQAEELDPTLDVLDTMRAAGSAEKESRLRNILGCFLFTGDDVFKKVNVLSGGEKSRLALAKMLLSKANFLIFDEPTNHLDMASKAILQQALQQYAGTLMIVSHDRAFLDPIVDSVLEVRKGSLKKYPGNVSRYLEYKQKEKESSEVRTSAGRQTDSEKSSSRKEEKRREAGRRNERNRKIKPLRSKLASIENSITKHENLLKNLEEEMAHPTFYEDNEMIKKTSLMYESTKKELTHFYSEWEHMMSRIEAAEKEFNAD